MITKKIFSGLLLTATLSLNAYAQVNEVQPRIISAGAGLTELFFALGAQDSLVAVDMTSRQYAKQSNLPQVGYHRQLSAEGLMSLSPTMLIGTDEMGPETTLELLTASKVVVRKVATGNTLALLNQRIDTIAELTGKQAQAQQLKKQVLQNVVSLQSTPLSDPPNVLFLMLNKDRAPTVGGNNTSINTVIELSGAINPAAKLMESYKPISFEGIIKMQPDTILVSQRAWDSFGGKDKILEKLPLLAATPAGQRAQIVPVPSSALIGFGLESIKLAEQLQQSFLAQQE